jgi:hypothetical protein
MPSLNVCVSWGEKQLRNTDAERVTRVGRWEFVVKKTKRERDSLVDLEFM